jgi:hypothetical protein
MTVEQYSIESIFHEMGFKSSTDYAIRKAQEELLQELKICSERIAVFEKKYGMTYEEFYKRFHELTQFGLIEREDDSMDWKVEVHEIRAVEKLLVQLAA